MKSTILVVLLLITATIVRSDNLHPAEGGSKYSDSTYKFELAPPDFGEGSGNVMPVTFTAPAADGFAANVNVMIQVTQLARDKYIARSKQQVEQMQGQMTGIKELHVNGHDAVRMQFTMTSKKKDLQYLSLAVFADGKVYLITCTDTQSQFETHREEFEKCLNSFRLNP